MDHRPRKEADREPRLTSAEAQEAVTTQRQLGVAEPSALPPCGLHLSQCRRDGGRQKGSPPC